MKREKKWNSNRAAESMMEYLEKKELPISHTTCGLALQINNENAMPLCTLVCQFYG